MKESLHPPRRIGMKRKETANSLRTCCPMCGATHHRYLARKPRANKDFHLLQCARCHQHFCFPAPTSNEIAGFYQGNYHAELRVDGGTEKRFGPKFARYRDWVLQFVRGGRSLDIGTSTGLFPSLLKRAGFAAEGLEYHRASAQWGEAHYGVEIRTCELDAAGAEPSSYDLISMTDVLEHTAHPLRYLQTACRYLKPSGFMLITFPDINSIESCYVRFLAHLLRRDWIWYCCNIPGHVWEFTPSTARAMFDKAGFDVQGFRRSQLPPESLPGVLRILTLPLHLLRMPGISRLAGTQMEFMIRKRSE